jgi:uncharacterized membrane protein
MNNIIRNCATKEKPLKPIEDTLYPKVLERAKKTKSKIDVDTLHRAKAVQRKRDILKAKSDIDNEELMKEIENDFFPKLPNWYRNKLYKKMYDNYSIVGTYGIRREQKIQYKKIIWRIVIIFILIVVAYMVYCSFN